MKKFFFTLLLFCLIFAALGSQVFAQPTGGGNPSTGGGVPTTGGGNAPTGGGNPVGVKFTIPNPFKSDVVGDSLFGLMKAIVDKIILPVGAVLCVLAFIYAGFLFVMAGGDTAKIKTARTALLYAAIGTAILLGSWVLANAICNTINLLGGPVCPV